MSRQRLFWLRDGKPKTGEPPTQKTGLPGRHAGGVLPLHPEPWKAYRPRCANLLSESQKRKSATQTLGRAAEVGKAVMGWRESESGEIDRVVESATRNGPTVWG